MTPGTIVRVMTLNREKLQGRCYAVVLDPDIYPNTDITDASIRILTGMAYARAIESVDDELTTSSEPGVLILEGPVDEVHAIPEHLVPDEVWAALAQWRLTQ